MTREEAIENIKLIRFSATISTFKEALDMAIEALSNTELPSNLDEAANNYSLTARLGYPRVMDETDRYIYNAFKAGAEWMAGQGVVLNRSIDELSCGAYNACVKQGLTSEDDVIIQIRKK